MLDQGASFAVPAGTRRVALVGLGDGSGAADEDVVGWASDVPLPYVGGEVFLGHGVVIASSGRTPSRRTSPVRVGWVAPDTVVAGTTAVVTTFSRPVDLIAISMEGGDGDDLALGIDGASRATDAAGLPEPPTLIADGPRAVAIFRLAPGDRPPIVTVATGPSRRLAGVAGATGVGPATFANAVADRGFPTVVPDPVPVASGVANIVWKGP